MSIESARSRIINKIIKIEGGFVDDPRDSGGVTNFGITFKDNAKELGKIGITSPDKMRLLTKEQAEHIYAKKYWDPLGLDTVVQFDERLAEKIFDIGVNMGIGRAGLFVQQLLNALNDGGRLWPDIAEDGAVGPKTIQCLLDLYSTRRDAGFSVFYKGLNAMQGAFYIDLARRREKDEAFLFGWLRNRIS